MFALPLYKWLFPDFVFVHVLRDGRDIALSGNQKQVTLRSPHALPPRPCPSA